MSPQTLHKIESGGTRSVSPAARAKIAPVLGVPEESLIMPIGSPIPPVGGYEGVISDDTGRLLLLEVKLAREERRAQERSQNELWARMIELLEQILTRMG
jgi:transcriptional regulator with XRE-family HTH domain